jgi:hypothetical protein
MGKLHERGHVVYVGVVFIVCHRQNHFDEKSS